jgi:predicted nuclease of restriction endonuclease-like (RecB) superfamily
MNIKIKNATAISTKKYRLFIEQLKTKVQQAQLKAALSVNSELIKLYFEIGHAIVEKQKEEGWGAGIIEKIGTDLQNMFPGMQGFSRANIFRMRAFYLAYEKVAQAVRLLEKLPILQIPWGHNIVLIAKIKDVEERLWYAEQTIGNGLSRSALEDWIKTNVYARKGKAITNFSQRLPSLQSQLAQETLKDPYNFDFMTLTTGYLERELEQGLMDHIQKFLLELGEGFSFVGRQYHLEVDETDYYLDLLFYHLKLRCYVVVELKTTDFKPEYAGKLNFYLSAVDDLLRHPSDNPTIGLILCRTKKNFTAEYALRDINKPMGVAQYATKLVEVLPKNLKSKLPSIEQIEAAIEEHIPEKKQVRAKKKTKKVEKPKKISSKKKTKIL